MYSARFDHYFKIYTPLYFEAGEVNWPWFKALAAAESSLNPSAVSPAGAIGIMQLMPETSAEVAQDLWLPNSPLEPRTNILFGIHYAWKMWAIFKKETGLERVRVMFGAYNAGAGSIIEAQKLAKQPDQWDYICEVLPHVTGDDNASQTIGYVDKIFRIREEL